MPVEVPDVAEPLFNVPPESFVEARSQLVKRLRSSGERELAEVVSRLRRPTVAAAALNHLARTAPDAVEALAQVAAELARAQRHAVSGVPGGEVRNAVRAHQAAIDALMAQAPDRATWSTGVTDQVANTLRAAAVDPGVAERLRRGVLSSAADIPGADAALGMMAPLTLVRDPQPGQHPEPAEEPSRSRRDEAQAQARRDLVAAQARLERAMAARTAATRKAEQARARARQAAQEAASARHRADEAARVAEELAARATQAERHAMDTDRQAQELSQVAEVSVKDEQDAQRHRDLAREAVERAGPQG